MIDKFQAAMLGYAIGDALAAPIEDVTRDSFEGPKLITEFIRAFPSHPISHLDVGQYSDETQVMLVVADSLIAARGFSIDDLANRFVDWFHSQKQRSAWRFPSNTMMKACRKLASGVPWNQAGFPSAGVIAAARTVPISLVFWRTPALLRDSIEKSCRLTHTDPRVIAASLTLATAIRMGLEGGEPAPEVLINSAIEKAQGYSPEIVKRLKILRDSLRLDPPAAMEQLGNGGFCYDSVPAALYWFFRHPRRFDEMIVGAANVGGDSDAIAAMAGAVFGAFNGLSAIPDHWLRQLEDCARIKQLGCDLYRLAVPQK